jgi:tetratricopeptide (TPR) repeat protein
MHRELRRARLTVAALIALPLAAAGAQQSNNLGGPGGPRNPVFQEATRLDAEGKTAEARAMLKPIIDTASDAALKAAAHRVTAMSYGFDGDCANAVKHEMAVIDYWKTREQAEPQNAFYQEGEMANEAARLCIDAGKLDEAERMYRLGRELGIKEPEPKTHPASLWEYRTAHALARIAARRGNRAEAERQIAEARRILDADPAMARQQERYFPYLVGYVALYTGDLQKAEAELTKALAANQNDPFMHALVGMTHERMGHADVARTHYQHAYDMSGGHNPPAAFARPFARQKLGMKVTK